MLRDIALEVSERLAAGEPFALATVVRTQGSVPGKLGFQLLVRPDLSQLGTVGGAGLERKVHAACCEALESGVSRLLQFELNRDLEGGLDSLCGGSVDVFIHAVPRKRHVLLVGGGHIALEVARLCDQLDDLHSVLDDRPEFAAESRFPNAQARYLLGPQDLEGKLDPEPYTHALVAGYSHRQDLESVVWLLRRFKGHIASIGSAKRRQAFATALAERGFSQTDIARIECPVGVPIGAETPAELAVSIVAGFIGQHHSTATAPTSHDRAAEAAPGEDKP